MSNVEAQISTEKKKNGKEYPISLGSHILQHITTVSHCCTFGVSFYLIYLCFLDFNLFFDWHVLLYTIGWMILMTESVIMVTKDNIFSARITHLLRVRYHWVLQLLGAIFSITGFGVAFAQKAVNDREHFKSKHGYWGMICTVLLIPACVNGVAALFSADLRKFIKPKYIKNFHALTGILTVCIGGVGMITGIKTGWFTYRTAENRDIYVISYIAIVFGIFWSLVRPAITFVDRLRS